MKLDFKTKQEIDAWFSERTPEEVAYIVEKHLLVKEDVSAFIDILNTTFKRLARTEPNLPERL